MMGVLDDDCEEVLVAEMAASVSSSSSAVRWSMTDSESAPLADGCASLSPGSWELIALN